MKNFGKTTVNEIIEEEKGNYEDVEVWQYLDHTRKLHADFIKNIDGTYGKDVYGDLAAYEYQLMNEYDYENQILVYEDADFEDLYGNKDAKVLVILLDSNIDIEELYQVKYKAQEKYDKNNTQRFSLKLNKTTDKEIIEWLERQPSKQGAIKSAIETVMKNE